MPPVKQKRILTTVLCAVGGVINAHSEYAKYVYMVSKNGTTSGVSKLTNPMTARLTSTEFSKATKAVPASGTRISATGVVKAKESVLEAASDENSDSKLTDETLDFLNTNGVVGLNTPIPVLARMLKIYNSSLTTPNTSLKINLLSELSKAWPESRDISERKLAMFSTCAETFIIVAFIAVILTYVETDAEENSAAFMALCDVLKQRPENNKLNTKNLYELAKKYYKTGTFGFPNKSEMNNVGIGCSDSS